MDDMKALKKLVWVGCLAALGAFIIPAMVPTPAPADTGHEGAVRIEQGSYGQMFKYSGSSIAGTAFVSDTVKRPDGMCRNNTATEVWIGTVSATQRGSASFLHDNINFGQFLKSSETFTLGGSFTGSWYFTCAPGISSCEVRCVEGRVR